VRQRSPGHDQELEHVVEGRGVAPAFADDRQHLPEIVAEDVGAEQAFARAHPVDVAAQRVDLAVVRDVAVRVRERPRRKRVGAEALVDEGERRLDIGVGQIGKRRPDLIGREHALVDEGLRREAGHVEEMALAQLELIRRMLDTLADDVQLAFEPHRIGRDVRAAGDRAAGDEDLFDDGGRGDGRGADLGQVGRDGAPSQHLVTFFAGDSLEEAAEMVAFAGMARQKHEAGSVASLRRQADAERRRDLAQEAVGHLNQDARAVSGVRFAAAGAAVQEVDQHLQAALDDGVGARPLDVGDEADAAGIVLVARIVQSGGRGNSPRGVVRRRVGSHGGHVTDIYDATQSRSKIE